MGPRPDVETMCSGQCEGLGVYPQHVDDPNITDEESLRWQAAHDAGSGHDAGKCDGWHFIQCGECGGTGKKLNAA